ncbi:MAG: hypothetical protein ACJ72N_17440 [Labedaea sp.]
MSYVFGQPRTEAADLVRCFEARRQASRRDNPQWILDHVDATGRAIRSEVDDI